MKKYKTMKIRVYENGFHVSIYEDFPFKGRPEYEEWHESNEVDDIQILLESLCHEYEIPRFGIQLYGDNREWFTQMYIPQYRYQEFTMEEPNDILNLPDWIIKHVDVSCKKNYFDLSIYDYADLRGMYGDTIRYRPQDNEFEIISEPFWRS